MPSARSVGSGRATTSGWLGVLSNKVGVDDLLLAAQACHRPCPDQPSLRHHEYGVAQLLDEVELVLDHQNRQALGAQRLEVMLDLGDDTRVDARHRLVEQQAPLMEQQRAHELDEPLLGAA